MDAVRDLLWQALSSDPTTGAIQAAQYRAASDIHRAIIPRYIELTQQIVRDLEEAGKLSGAGSGA